MPPYKDHLTRIHEYNRNLVNGRRWWLTLNHGAVQKWFASDLDEVRLRVPYYNHRSLTPSAFAEQMGTIQGTRGAIHVLTHNWQPISWLHDTYRSDFWLVNAMDPKVPFVAYDHEYQTLDSRNLLGSTEPLVKLFQEWAEDNKDRMAYMCRPRTPVSMEELAYLFPEHKSRAPLQPEQNPPGFKKPGAALGGMYTVIYLSQEQEGNIAVHDGQVFNIHTSGRSPLDGPYNGTRPLTEGVHQVMAVTTKTGDRWSEDAVGWRLDGSCPHGGQWPVVMSEPGTRTREYVIPVKFALDRYRT